MTNNLIVDKITSKLNLSLKTVSAIITLTEEGSTIPFIARYRKEMTENADELIIEKVIETYNLIKELNKRRDAILKSLEEQNFLTPELEKALKESENIKTLEDIYLPYKPRKQTEADKAIEKGLKPLAELIIKKNPSKTDVLTHYIDNLKGKAETEEEAYQGAFAILVQMVSENSNVRKFLRENMNYGTLCSKKRRGFSEENSKYEDYYNFEEKISRIKSHRIMAILRGENEKVLSISISPSWENERLSEIFSKIAFGRNGEIFDEAAELALKKHLLKSIENEILTELKEKAEIESAEIFCRNLEKTLLNAPFGEKWVIGIDPGIRTGCKCALINQNGEYIDNKVIYLSSNSKEGEKLSEWIEKYPVEGIAIGSGTFGRESIEIIKNIFSNKNIVIELVDEDGASIYSASETAREEFPNLDITVRGAISIARRFQDPMAELVKINPKALGLGQYQHDISDKLLSEKLERTVSWAVNKVGVNINTAGNHLLTFISGLNKTRANAIIDYRNNNGRINNRSELNKIKGIGKNTFQQCAGFLRIKNGNNILDSTGVHPEFYSDVEKIAKLEKTSIKSILETPQILSKQKIKDNSDIKELDSILELLKSGDKDPRRTFASFSFNKDLKYFEDLYEGMIVNGIVDNVTAFGAFVDIGIKEKGLVHVSELSDNFIKDINSFIASGDRVKAIVIEIDKTRKRISLSIKSVPQN